MEKTMMISVEKRVKFSKTIPMNEKMEDHIAWLEEEIMDHLEELPIEIDYEYDDLHPESDGEMMVAELVKMED